MADQAAKDAAAQQRIINHMNADHHDSIVRYLEHYSGLSAWTAHTSKMTGIDLEGMDFQAGGKTYRISLGIPLESYRDARERVVEMDKACLKALGRSDIVVTEFIWPTGRYALEFTVCAAAFIGYSQRWWFAPGQMVEKYLGAGFASFSWTIQPWLIGGMIVIHAAELAWFIPSRLTKHNVHPWTLLFWQWCLAQFVAGIGCSTRFDKMVYWKREAKAKQRH